MRNGNVYKRLGLKCRLKWLSHKASCLCGKMLGNISDCVKKAFLYFTASLTLAWISIRIIYIRVYFVAINTSQSDLNESLKCINKN